MKVLALIAALDEEKGIGPTILELKEHIRDIEFLVVDGKSSDNTVSVAKELGAQVIIQKGNGKGDAVAEAVKKIETADYVVLTDADYTYPADTVPEMIKMLENDSKAGMICGNRFTPNFSLGRQHSLLFIGNRCISFIHNLLNGVHLDDPLTGLRVVRGNILEGWEPKSKSFDIEVELNHWVERRGYTIVELPIAYRQRVGVKKLKIRHGLTIMKRILMETVR